MVLKRDDVEDMIARALRAAEQCTADNPHEGGLRFIREGPGRYVCRCGKEYVKEIPGTLADRPIVRKGV